MKWCVLRTDLLGSSASDGGPPSAAGEAPVSIVLIVAAAAALPPAGHAGHVAGDAVGVVAHQEVRRHRRVQRAGADLLADPLCGQVADPVESGPATPRTPAARSVWHVSQVWAKSCSAGSPLPPRSAAVGAAAPSSCVVAGAPPAPPDGRPASRPERTPLIAAAATTTTNRMRKPNRRTVRASPASEGLAVGTRAG
jgi:hypothetical protein